MIEKIYADFLGKTEVVKEVNEDSSHPSDLKVRYILLDSLIL